MSVPKVGFAEIEMLLELLTCKEDVAVNEILSSINPERNLLIYIWLREFLFCFLDLDIFSKEAESVDWCPDAANRRLHQIQPLECVFEHSAQ